MVMGMGFSKGNKARQRPGTSAPSTVLFTMRITRREDAGYKELAQALNLESVAQLVRNAVSDYRMRAIANGLKLKR